MSMSRLKNKTFTIINRIPTSPENAQIAAYEKYLLKGCDFRLGFFDKSAEAIVYKSNTWTAWLDDWQHYKSPTWLDGGYYALTADEKNGFYTANNGDLLIFADISDDAPRNTSEFQALVSKYKDLGGLISSAEAYINYNSKKPWKTNHIELIKG